MPKRGGGQYSSGSRFSSLLDYGSYDNRNAERTNKERNVRRVSFKNTHNNQHKELKGRLAEMAIRSRLEDDEDMGDMMGASSSRFDERAGSRRKGSPIPKGKFGNLRRLVSNPFGWYQVTVQQGQRYSKDDVIRAILSAISPEIFIPHYWRTEKSCVVFFVDEFNVASRLQLIERGIQMPDGQRIFLRTRSNCPIVSVDEAFKEKMKLAMADRYNPHTKTLDISRFHTDPKFKGMFVGLFRYPVMSAALDIIVENIPDLVALFMNDNGLVGLEGFKNIPQRLPHLQSIHLSNNKIPSLAHLMSLRNVSIIDLVLEGNPLRQRYKDKAHYISEVRRKFPKVQKLDGELLEPKIHFELEDNNNKLPEAKASYLCDNSAAGIIREFLETYFKIFDSDNRTPLMAAYHTDAMMSINVPPASQCGRLEKFWSLNRNLRRIEHYNANEEVIKYRCLKVGNLPIVAVLAELPKTQHDLLSFSVDLTLYVEGKMMIFTVGGLFKELDSSASNGGEIRYFRREFVVVPSGPRSFCIRNELFFVTSATHIQTRKFMMHGSGASTSSNAPGISAGGSIQNRLQMQQPTSVHIPQGMLQQSSATPAMVPVAAATPTPAQLDENTKLQMVQALSAQTSMNLGWSKKCLEETHWDYNHAVFVFDKLHKESKIPAEAFLK